MNLESLANEILLDLLEYLDAVNLFRAFHGLNARFDQLIFIKLQRYYLDFRSIALRDFDIFHQEYLPLINDRIITFHLSDDIETPNMSQHFLLHNYIIKQFIHLKLLFIDYIYSFDVLNKLILQCRELSYLTHLYISINTYQDPAENFHDFINNIWSLPNLTHCHLDIIHPYAIQLIQMSVISQSINYLSIQNINYDLHSLSHLLLHTTYLQRLHIYGISQYDDYQPQTMFPSIISFKTSFQGSVQSMKNLFQIMPNLKYLTLETNTIYLDGYAWEKVFLTYLPNIKIFRLKMRVELLPLSDVEQQIDEIFHSFRTEFWIEKHQWYVQCDWCPMDINKIGILYTLPYAFDTFYFTDGSRSKSTSPNDFHDSAYNQVQILEHIHRRQNLNEDFPLFTFRFLNIRHLSTVFPFNNDFWSAIPKLNQLISLNAVLNQDFGYPQLQALLNIAPRLYSLSFSHSNNFSMASFNISSISIRRFELFQNFKCGLRYFKNAECSMLTRTFIAFQCEVLLVDVESRTNVFNFINTMPNLRVLIVRCKDDERSRHHSSETNDELIVWFQDQLSSKLMYSIIRNANDGSQLIISIYRQKNRHL
ncbi:unnamed protein product [Rotaria sp. Silwood1]|nr:unnamed protein product [Rotaria sp. Silwood1]